MRPVALLFLFAFSLMHAATKEHLLTQHNTERSQFSNCPPLVWDPRLATIAQNAVSSEAFLTFSDCTKGNQCKGFPDQTTRTAMQMAYAEAQGVPYTGDRAQTLGLNYASTCFRAGAFY